MTLSSIGGAYLWLNSHSNSTPWSYILKLYIVIQRCFYYYYYTFIFLSLLSYFLTYITPMWILGKSKCPNSKSYIIGSILSLKDKNFDIKYLCQISFNKMSKLQHNSSILWSIQWPVYFFFFIGLIKQPVCYNLILSGLLSILKHNTHSVVIYQ